MAASIKKANDRIFDLVNNRYFTSIPLDELFGIVEGAGFRLDPEERACILAGRQGRATWQLFDGFRKVNHLLVLQWYKMDSTGRYELVSYVS